VDNTNSTSKKFRKSGSRWMCRRPYCLKLLSCSQMKMLINTW
jgi:hypothetical protein